MDRILVRDVMTREPIVVRENDLVTKARAIIRDFGYRALPVVDESGEKFSGIITRSAILEIPDTRSNLEVRGFMEENVATARESDSLAEVVREMVKRRQEIVPVLDGSGRVIGVLSWVDVLRKIVELGLKPKKKVVDIMKDPIVLCKPDDHVTTVWARLVDGGVSGAIVVDDDNRVVGVVTRMDLIEHGATRVSLKEDAPHPASISRVMKRGPIVAYLETPVDEIARMMLDHNISKVPIVDLENRLLGEVHALDVLSAFL